MENSIQHFTILQACKIDQNHRSLCHRASNYCFSNTITSCSLDCGRVCHEYHEASGSGSTAASRNIHKHLQVFRSDLGVAKGAGCRAMAGIINSISLYFHYLSEGVKHIEQFNSNRCVQLVEAGLEATVLITFMSLSHATPAPIMAPMQLVSRTAPLHEYSYSSHEQLITMIKLQSHMGQLC